MRRKAKIDANQAAIVKALRAVGCTVQSLGQVGGGCPDLLVARAGRTWLLEVKTATGTPNQMQLDWAARWRAAVYVVRSVDEAFTALNLSSC